MSLVLAPGAAVVGDLFSPGHLHLLFGPYHSATVTNRKKHPSKYSHGNKKKQKFEGSCSSKLEQTVKIISSQKKKLTLFRQVGQRKTKTRNGGQRSEGRTRPEVRGKDKVRGSRNASSTLQYSRCPHVGAGTLPGERIVINRNLEKK